MNGKIHSIQSFATHDGDGIRAAVFMHGCNLKCVYCHNPDTWCGLPKLTMTPNQLATKLLRFKPYFSRGGGVTFSGGEPLLQSEFIAQTIDILQKDNLNFVLDSALSICGSHVNTLLAKCHTIIADLKFTTAKEYKKYTQSDVFDKVIANLDYLKSIKKPLVLRTVVVPDINNTKADIEGYKRLAANYKDILIKHEFLPFSTLGFSKYDDLKIANPLELTPPLTLDELERLLS